MSTRSLYRNYIGPNWTHEQIRENAECYKGAESVQIGVLADPKHVEKNAMLYTSRLCSDQFGDDMDYDYNIQELATYLSTGICERKLRSEFFVYDDFSVDSFFLEMDAFLVFYDRLSRESFDYAIERATRLKAYREEEGLSTIMVLAPDGSRYHQLGQSCYISTLRNDTRKVLLNDFQFAPTLAELILDFLRVDEDVVSNATDFKEEQMAAMKLQAVFTEINSDKYFGPKNAFHDCINAYIHYNWSTSNPEPNSQTRKSMFHVSLAKTAKSMSTFFGRQRGSAA